MRVDTGKQNKVHPYSTLEKKLKTLEKNKNLYFEPFCS